MNHVFTLTINNSNVVHMGKSYAFDWHAYARVKQGHHLQDLWLV